MLTKRSQGDNTDETNQSQTWLHAEVQEHAFYGESDGGGAVTGALSALTSKFSSTGTSVASALAAVGRQVDATFSAGALENARSALKERERTVRLRRAVDSAYRSMELDRSA